jgi:hypothetical protein
MKTTEHIEYIISTGDNLLVDIKPPKAQDCGCKKDLIDMKYKITHKSGYESVLPTPSDYFTNP